jgi:hypothetical protein
MLKVLSPGVKHTQEADLRAKMLGIGGDFLQGCGAGAEQEIVDDLLVLQGQPRQLVGNRKDDMHIVDRQQFLAASGEPFVTGAGLALWTVSERQELKEMASWPHWRQRSRWPPRAAVRQYSMAESTRR